jgi:hypothetical protein
MHQKTENSKLREKIKEMLGRRAPALDDQRGNKDREELTRTIESLKL